MQQQAIEPATVLQTSAVSGGAWRKFPHHLNADDLRKIGGFQIQWTDDLMSHLTLRGPVVYLFHHVSVLRRMRKSVPENVFPGAFIDETLATINMLIPHTNASCNRWLRTEIETQGLDPTMMYRTSASRVSTEYPFWRERLDTIVDALETSKPRNFYQWWHDRRDMREWWGFWLVVTGIFLTVLFGLIQSVTGVIQIARPSGS